MSKQISCGYCLGMIQENQPRIPDGKKKNPGLIHANWQDCSASLRDPIKIRSRPDGRARIGDRERK